MDRQAHATTEPPAELPDELPTEPPAELLAELPAELPDELQDQLANALVGLELRLDQLVARARKLESRAGGVLFWRLRHADPMALTGLARRLQARLAAVTACSIRRHERAMLQNDARATSSEQPDPDGP